MDGGGVGGSVLELPRRRKDASMGPAMPQPIIRIDWRAGLLLVVIVA